EGKAVSIVSTNMDLQGMDKDAAGVSNLILSTDIYALPKAQDATDPFAFGGLKVVPKSDASFKTGDELWYFFELRNPGLEADAKDPKVTAPKIMVKVAVNGTSSDGKKVHIEAPESKVEIGSVKGVQGHYIFGQSIPAQTFKPGSYSLKLTATDAVLK